jgi:hypothetical protein
MESASVIAVSLAFVNILYLIIAVGIININATYIRWLSIIVQSAVCAYLIYNFNPYIYRVFTPSRSDAYIIFWCAVLFANNILVSELANTQLSNTILYVRSEPVSILKDILNT